MRTLALAALLAAPSLAPAQTMPATTRAAATSPADVARVAFEAQWRDTFADELERMEARPARPIEKVLTLAVIDGQLDLKVADDVPNGSAIALPGGRAAVNVLKFRRGGRDFPNVTIVACDGFGTPEPAGRHIHLLVTPMNTQIGITIEKPDARTIADLVNTTADNSLAGGDPPLTTLHFTSGVAKPPAGDAAAATEPAEAEMIDRAIDVKATSYRELIDAHHDDVHAAMFELFATIRSAHVLSGLSEAEARQLISKPTDAAALGELLALVDRDDAASTAEARKRLAGAEGRALAGALSAADRRGWTPDRSMKVDALLADATPLAQRDVERVSGSAGRLIDLLYWPDAEIRRGAKALVEKRLGKPIDLDPADDPYAHQLAIETLRALAK